jgi:hypothetical protein
VFPQKGSTETTGSAQGKAFPQISVFRAPYVEAMAFDAAALFQKLLWKG